MTTKMGIRDITRNFSILDEYDYVEIEDKKTHKTKGLFVSQKYADEVKKMLEDKARLKKQKEIEEMKDYVGIFNGEFGDMSAQDIKAKKREKYYE